MFAAQPKTRVVPSLSPSREGITVWKEIIDPVKPFLEQVAERLAEQVQAFDPEIFPYAHYALTNHGKQLRPVLVALSGSATGKVNDSLVTVAVIIEMVHLATLVHDDVLDEAAIRRKRPTLAANWGNEVSVLLGDCLFAHALKLAASFPTPEICRAVASATNTVCSGEILQTHQRRNFDFTRTDYFRVLEMKTAELFALSCDLGSWLAGASEPARQALRRFGMSLGTAYQLYDDCLDVFGSESTVGKSLGTDLANGKLTFPLFVILERGTLEDRKQLQQYIRDWNPRWFGEIVTLLDKYDARTECHAVISRLLDEARESLREVPETASRRSLVSLTDYLAQQSALLGVCS